MLFVTTKKYTHFLYIFSLFNKMIQKPYYIIYAGFIFSETLFQTKFTSTAKLMRFQTVSMTTPVIRLIRMGAFDIEVQSQTHQVVIKSTGLRR